MAKSGDDNTIPFRSPRADGDTLGGRIWRARDALDLSLGELAARMGLPEETVGDWERDHAEPRTQALFMLAGVLGVSPSWLIAGIGQAPSETGPEASTHPLFERLEEIRRLHIQTGEAIDALEAEIARLGLRGRRSDD
ncbi:transcriptional regulator with XRE-family HTH domain [Rhizobium azooxidifex]|jgi:transcriptional regulator with XRE-family HTH domain|uniref:Transcriptional regulator with XRE-family HTH domain n=1 Tax=Mycoplana azooxidifex TaxID=1636188 RepID=A0A7W6D2R3_9HYPH|nr:helix-turn-helix domain-containing protein [Mycoplana azooxidifex]MBB3974992.1 transcriptional regulator with XRE-family HTH domain [Mycoplana azooxidifex]